MRREREEGRGETRKKQYTLLSTLSLLPSSLCLLLVWLLAVAVSAGDSLPSAAYRGKNASQWAEELGEEDYWVRWHAAYALGRIGPEAAVAVPALERILANLDEHEYVRGGAAWALGRLGSKAATAMPLLTRTLASKHISVRRNAARALGSIAAAQASGRMGPIGLMGPIRPISPISPVLPPNAADSLLKLLSDHDAPVRVSAAVALWQVERHPKAIPALESMLRDRSVSTAYEAASALGELGTEAEPAVPALIAALAYEDDDMRRTAAYVLGRVGPAAIPAVRGLLATTDERTKCQAVEALGWIGSASVSALTECLADPGPSVRRAAARALGRLGAAAKPAEPALVKAVSDPDRDVRDAAALALRLVRGS